MSSSVPMRWIGWNWRSNSRSAGRTSSAETPAPSVALGRIELTVTPRAQISLARTSTMNRGASLLLGVCQYIAIHQ